MRIAILFLHITAYTTIFVHGGAMNDTQLGKVTQAYERLSSLLNDDDGIGREVTSAVGEELDAIRAELQDVIEGRPIEHAAGEPDAVIPEDEGSVWHKTGRQLREDGYAVIIWTPEELGDARPHKVEDRLIELGWDVISDLDGPSGGGESDDEDEDEDAEAGK